MDFMKFAIHHPFLRSNNGHANDALLLDMGEFMHRPPTSQMPEILSIKDYNPQDSRLSGSASNRLSNRVTPELAGSSDAQEGHGADGDGRKHISDAPWMPTAANSRKSNPSGLNRFKLYQILSPQLAFRGRVFGTKLALKDEWVKIDASFFDAPGG